MITRNDITTLEDAADVLKGLGHPVKSILLARMAERLKCPCCGGSGFVSRDPDIGTDQECPSCDGNPGVNIDALESERPFYPLSE